MRCGKRSSRAYRASRGVHSPQVAMLTDGELRRYGKIGFNCPDPTSMSRRLNSWEFISSQNRNADALTQAASGDTQ